MKNNKVAIVTGASSGMGKSVALELQKTGYKVYGVSRRLEKMQDLKSRGVEIMQLDVTKPESINEVMESIISKNGRIDVLINAAGYGSFGSVEEVPITEGRQQMEVNLFGVVALIKAVLPVMKANKSGKIINITSIGGKVWTPLGSWYHASKFALEGFSDSLRLELKPLGIDVVVIEPGSIETEWGSISVNHIKETNKLPEYKDLANKTIKRFEHSDGKSSPPEVVTKAIMAAINSFNPKTRYAIGRGAKSALFMKKILSDKMFDKLLRKYF